MDPENTTQDGCPSGAATCSHLVILDEPTEDDDWVSKTNHPLVTYDTSVETFVVDCGGGTWAEFWGRARADAALRYANMLDKAEAEARIRPSKFFGER